MMEDYYDNYMRLSTEVTSEDLENAVEDEYGVLYSDDGKRLLKCKNKQVLKGKSCHLSQNDDDEDTIYNKDVEGVEYKVKENTKVICDRAFYNCYNLEEIIIPNSVIKIGKSAFAYCNNLQNITIPSGVTVIGDMAFWGCILAWRVSIPDSVIEIGGKAFAKCILHNIEVSQDNKYFCVKDGVLFSKKMDRLIYTASSCSHQSYDIPDTVFKIDDYAFYSCRFNTVSIPNSVTEIGSWAFYGCVNLTKITIPYSVTKIGDCAFENCQKLTELKVAKSNECFADKDGVLFSRELDTLIKIPFKYPHSSYEIPNHVIKIGKYAFSLQKDTLSSKGDALLTNISIPNSVTEIGDGAFSSRTNLTEITLPNSVTKIGKFAFFGCEKLTHINIPDSVTEIGVSAFDECQKLTTICVDENNKCFCTKDGVLFSKEMDILIRFPIDFPYMVYDIPICVTKINNCAFFSCSRLNKVSIPKSVTEIGDMAFCDCQNIERIVSLNPDPPICGKYAFDNIHENIYPYPVMVDTILILKVPEGAENAYSSAPGWDNLLRNHWRVKGGARPSEVAVIETVCWPHDEHDEPRSEWENVDFDSGVADEYGVLYSVVGCKRLLGAKNFAYSQYEVKDGTEVICDKAFENAERLTKIIIPDSVTEIGYRVFWNCQNIEKIVSLNPNPPLCENFACPGLPTETSVLCVPKGAKDAYSKATGWDEFKNIEELEETA